MNCIKRIYISVSGTMLPYTLDIQNILNSMTPNSLDEEETVRCAVVELYQFRTLRGLLHNVELIMNKTMETPKFSRVYAKICDRLRCYGLMLEVTVTFEKLLKVRCQKEFDKVGFNTRLDACYDTIEVKYALPDLVEGIALYNKRIQKENMSRRFIGFIRLVAELYHADWWTLHDMHDIIQERLILHQDPQIPT